MTFRVRSAGMLTTVQDLGRFRFAHLGISPAGPADAQSFRIANLLVGNKANEPALEMTLFGASLEFESRAVVSLAGAKVLGKKGAPLTMWSVLEFPAGAVLEMGQIAQGVRTYLAVQGGINVPQRMRSASTHLASGTGGWKGRALKPGDVLEFGASSHGSTRELKPAIVAKLKGAGHLRVTPGVQSNGFSKEAMERFLAADYIVSEQSNRASLKLSGEAVHPAESSELLMEGTSLGAIQILPNGQPVIVFVDQQTTGSYPKIANVIAADLHRIGQIRPKERIRFKLVSVENALQFLKQQEEMLREAFV